MKILTDTFICMHLIICIAFLPTIVKLGAQTSIVSLPHGFITQWYSNEELLHECEIFSQPFLEAASFHSSTF